MRPERALPVARGGAVEVLEAVRAPGTDIAIWERTLAPDLAAWLDGLDPACLPDRRLVAPPEGCGALFAEVCDLAGMPEGPARAALAADMAGLVAAFGRASGAPAAAIRLRRIGGDACRLFHQDARRLRLICTFRGPGTDWGLGAPGAAPRRVERLARGHAAILRGVWGGAVPAVVHRSPPVAGSGVTRFVIVVDDVRDDGEDGG